MCHHPVLLQGFVWQKSSLTASLWRTVGWAQVHVCTSRCWNSQSHVCPSRNLFILSFIFPTKDVKGGGCGGWTCKEEFVSLCLSPFVFTLASRHPIEFQRQSPNHFFSRRHILPHSIQLRVTIIQLNAWFTVRTREINQNYGLPRDLKTDSGVLPFQWVELQQTPAQTITNYQ